MRTRSLSLRVGIALVGVMSVACTSACAGQTSRPASPVVDTAHAAVESRVLHHEGADYFVVAVDTQRADVDLLLRDTQDAPLSTFTRVEAHLTHAGRTLLFATNAGMFHPDGMPVGLHIASGVELAPLNTTEHADGNFFLQPNGAFWIGQDRVAHVDTTKVFQTKSRSEVLLATQSGPMLVIDRALHPAFDARSANLNIRSGVGILPDGRTAFLLSSTPVNFDAFAHAFRDGLGARQALYLDGAISKMYAPELGLTDLSGRFGGILTVSAPRLPTCEPSACAEDACDPTHQSRDDPAPRWPPPPDSR